MEREPLRYCKCDGKVTFTIPFQDIYPFIKGDLAQHQEMSCKGDLTLMALFPNLGASAASMVNNAHISDLENRLGGLPEHTSVIKTRWLKHTFWPCCISSKKKLNLCFCVCLCDFYYNEFCQPCCSHNKKAPIELHYILLLPLHNSPLSVGHYNLDD